MGIIYNFAPTPYAAKATNRIGFLAAFLRLCFSNPSETKRLTPLADQENHEKLLEGVQHSLSAETRSFFVGDILQARQERHGREK